MEIYSSKSKIFQKQEIKYFKFWIMRSDRPKFQKKIQKTRVIVSLMLDAMGHQAVGRLGGNLVKMYFS